MPVSSKRSSSAVGDRVLRSCEIAVHGGDGLQMISFGPVIEHAHTPDERVSISSVCTFSRILTRILAELAEALPPA